MIKNLLIRNYKDIRASNLDALSHFHVLVGPNGSGKSTWLDALDFVRECLQDGPRKAVERRVPDFRDLTFMRRGGMIGFDLQLDLTDMLPGDLGKDLWYRLAIASDKRLGVHSAWKP